MTSHPLPKVSRAPAFPFIWVVPLLAVAIGLWMGYRELHDRGPEIVIDFADGSGIEAGKTTLEYKGVSAGVVKRVELQPDLSGVTVLVLLNKNATPLANAGGQFWIVHPEIGFSGVHGLDTLLSGVRLNVRPGKGPTAKHFTGLDKTPPPEISDKGRTFILKSDVLGSLTTGSPVLYRQLKIGEVETSRLSEDSTSVLVRIHIDSAYSDLVRTSSRFWNAGGFSFKVSLFGAQVKNTSLESLVSGGVAFATPDAEPLAPAAAEGAQFTLASEPEKEWLKWSPKIPIKSPETMPRPPDKGTLLPDLLKR